MGTPKDAPLQGGCNPGTPRTQPAVGRGGLGTPCCDFGVLGRGVGGGGGGGPYSFSKALLEGLRVARFWNSTLSPASPSSP